MTKSKKVRKENAIQEVTRYTIEQLRYPDIRGRMETMAKAVQKLMRAGCEAPFVAAVIKDNCCFVRPVEEIWGDDHKDVVKQVVLDLAARIDADCIVCASAAWSAPNYPDLRPSLHSLRKEVVMVIARDNFEHLLGTQCVHRNGAEIEFHDLRISHSCSSWLDDCPTLRKTAAAC